MRACALLQPRPVHFTRALHSATEAGLLVLAFEGATRSRAQGLGALCLVQVDPGVEVVSDVVVLDILGAVEARTIEPGDGLEGNSLVVGDVSEELEEREGRTGVMEEEESGDGVLHGSAGARAVRAAARVVEELLDLRLREIEGLDKDFVAGEGECMRVGRALGMPRSRREQDRVDAVHPIEDPETVVVARESEGVALSRCAAHSDAASYSVS